MAEVGYVDNFWAIENYILRLATRIFELKKMGYEIEAKSGAECELPHKMHKNHYYFLKSNNEKIPYGRSIAEILTELRPSG